MIRFLVALDLWVRKLLAAFCVFMLAMMVVFTVYTIVMRYVFHDPPMWGDLLTSLSNIWFVFIALSLTVRDKEQIALNLISGSCSSPFPSRCATRSRSRST